MKNKSEIKQSFNPESMDYSKLSACSCIIVDGDPGSGKTTLARRMANELGAKVISLDDYLPGNQRPYLEQLDYEALRNNILSSAQKVVVEGVCTLKALGKIHVRHDYHIFTKLVVFGRREYDDYLDERSKLPKSSLPREVAQYYRECRPLEICDFIRTRILDLN